MIVVIAVMQDRQLICIFLIFYYNVKIFENSIHNKAIKNSLKYECIILISFSFMHNYKNENSRA
jgi:hypothetical protein